MPRQMPGPEQKRLIAAVVSALAVGAILLADWETGPDINLNVFYAGPALLMAHYWGTRGGLITALTASLVSLGGDVLLHTTSVDSLSALLWNGAVRGTMLALITVLYARLQASHESSHERATLFESVVESSSEAIAISNPEGRFVYANPAYERLFGRPLPQITGQPIRSLLAAESSGGANGRFLAAREQREPWTGLVDALDASGRAFPLWVRGEYVRDSNGDVRYGFGLMHDVTDERRTQEELRVSRSLLEHAMEQAMLAYWELDLATQTFTFNDRFYRLYATTAEREGGYRMPRDVFECELTPDGKSPVVQADIARLLTGELKELRFEHPIRRRDGKIRRMRTVVDAVRNESGAIVGTHGSDQDVTDLRLVQEALQATVVRLRESEERFVSMAANSPAMIYRDSNRRGGRYYSPRTIDVIGVAPEALVDDPSIWRDVIHPDDLERATAMAAALRSRPCEQTGECRIRRADGERWVRIRATSHVLPDGELVTDGLVTDVTELHRADAALRAANATLESVVESTGDVIAMMDRERRYVFFNTAFHHECRKIFGKDLKPGDRLADILAGVPEDLANAMVYWNRALGGEAFTVTQQFGDATLARNWYALSFNPVRNAAGEVTGAVHIVRDVSEEKRAEEAVARSLRQKETLLREIHHRVKNNMQVISSMLNLQGQAAGSPGLKEVFVVAQQRVQSMALLHEKLYQTADVADIDFAEYLRALGQETMNAHGLGPPRITFRVEGHGVRLDLSQAVPCALAVNELLTNAFKHAFPAPRAGTITIDVAREPGRNLVTVRDDGAGLPAGFDLAKTRSLGLRLVEVLVRQLRGTFRLTSMAGVSAEISFPSNESPQ